MKIGFIDHYLHNFHSKKFHSLLTGPLGGSEIQIVAAYEMASTGNDWCKDFNVPRAHSPEEVVEKSDVLIVLAPNNPESHLKLATPALKSGKTTFIDKILASSTQDARAILKLARANNTPVMSSSSLRFSEELEEMVARTPGPYDTVFSRGFGKWNGYSVHSIAPALRLFGHSIKRLVDTGVPGSRVVTLDDGQRRCLIEVREAKNQDDVSPWHIGVLKGDTYDTTLVKKADKFYENLMRHVVEFFKSGKAPIDAAEMFATVAVETAAEKSLAAGGQWVDIESL